MKIIGLFLVILCCSAIGYFLANNLVARQRQLEEIICFISSLKENINYRAMILKAIYLQAVDDEKIQFLFYKKPDNDLQVYYKQIVFQNKNLNLSKHDKVTMYRFLSGLGHSDVKSQERFCDMYKKIFENSKTLQYQNTKAKCKLYPSLGVLGGMLLAILLF